MSSATGRRAWAGLIGFLALGAINQLNGAELHLEIALDSSGSMAGTFGDGSRIDAAKAALERLAGSLPEDGRVNLGLRVFGHVGDASEATRPQSCATTELMVPVGWLDPESLVDVAQQIKPAGWTPLALALQRATGDLRPFDGTRSVVLISDGDESCDADPCAMAAELIAAGNAMRVHVLGIDLDPQAQATAACLAQTTGGVYVDAAHPQAISDALFALVNAESTTIDSALDTLHHHADRVPRMSLDDLSVGVDAALSVAPSGITIGDGIELRAGPGVTADSLLALSANWQQGAIHLSANGIEIRDPGGEPLLSITADGTTMRAMGRRMRDLGSALRGQPQSASSTSAPAQVVLAGDRTILNCQAGAPCVCEGDICMLNCADGGCEMACRGPATQCTFNCAGGNCAMACPAGLACTYHCPSGHCQRR